MLFKVVEIDENFYKVAINDKQQVAYIKILKAYNHYQSLDEFYKMNVIGFPGIKYNPKWMLFRTWETVMKDAQFITSDKPKLILYDKPNGNIIFENKDKRNFLPLKVEYAEGDWIKVKNQQYMGLFDPKKDYQGWVRWRQNDEILIEIFEQLNY